jgi:hypothetical protein
MTGNLGRDDIGVMVLPPMPVAAAHSRGPDLNDRAVRGQTWFWRVNHAQRTAEFLVLHCLHGWDTLT